MPALARLNCSDIDCQGRRNSVAGLGLGLGSWVLGLRSWVRSWLVGLGLAVSGLGGLVLELLPVALPSCPPATRLNCLDLSRFAVFILRSAMTAGCLSVYLSVYPTLNLLRFLTFISLCCAQAIRVCLPCLSVCLPLCRFVCRSSVYIARPQSYFQFSQVIESTQILLV